MIENNAKPKMSIGVTKWKLSEQSDYFYDLQDEIENKTGLEEVIEDIIQSKSSIPELTNNLLYYINESESLEEAIAKEIAILQERRARFKRRSEHLRDTVKMVFQRFDIKKMECPHGTISHVVRPRSRLNIIDEGELLINHSELYTRMEPKLDKVKLKALLESGEKVEGAELVDTYTIMVRK